MFGQSSLGILDKSPEIRSLYFPLFASRLLQSCKNIILGCRGSLYKDIFVGCLLRVNQGLSSSFTDISKLCASDSSLSAIVDRGLLVLQVESEKANLKAPNMVSITRH